VASRTQVLESVKSLRWRDVEAGLAATPKLIANRDERGRNFLHICCSVRQPRDDRASLHAEEGQPSVISAPCFDTAPGVT